MGLMGEAGPEAIVPLSRGQDGKLGVGAVAPVINIINQTGGQVEVEQNESGEVDVIIRAVKADFTRSMATGQGVWARGLEAGYNARGKTV